MKISQDFREFVEFANSRNLQFLIVGGYAVAFHGHPRYTKDLDIWIERTPENVDKLLAVLDDFGFGSAGLGKSDFLQPNRVIRLGKPPLQIDLLTSISGVEFPDCYPNRQYLVSDDVRLPFISIEDLKTNKRASGRHQDLADLENLE